MSGAVQFGAYLRGIETWKSGRTTASSAGSEPTYEGLKRRSRPAGEDRGGGSEPTYEGLKHAHRPGAGDHQAGSEPTYEGLKLRLVAPEHLREVGSEPTYEGLKHHGCVVVGKHSIRFGAYLRGIETGVSGCHGGDSPPVRSLPTRD